MKQTAGTVETNISGGTVTFMLDTADYENGIYDILVTARDAAGKCQPYLPNRMPYQ